eukprot:10573-Heterococcus_DN1.PRE.5
MPPCKKKSTGEAITNCSKCCAQLVYSMQCHLTGMQYEECTAAAVTAAATMISRCQAKITQQCTPTTARCISDSLARMQHFTVSLSA